MKPELRTELELYYGELMQVLETTFDYFERRKLEKKLQSILNILEL